MVGARCLGALYYFPPLARRTSCFSICRHRPQVTTPSSSEVTIGAIVPRPILTEPHTGRPSSPDRWTLSRHRFIRAAFGWIIALDTFTFRLTSDTTCQRLCERAMVLAARFASGGPADRGKGSGGPAGPNRLRDLGEMHKRLRYRDQRSEVETSANAVMPA